MHRRRFLAALGAILPFAGCLSTDAAVETGSTPDHPSLDCRDRETRTLDPDAPTPTESPTGSVSGLTVTSAADGNATFALYPEGRDTPTQVATVESGERVDWSQETRHWLDYRVVAYVDCERVGEAAAYSYESATVRVTEDGSVEKEVHAEA